MQTIQAYKTSDGKVFEIKEEAFAHENHLNFIRWYDEIADSLIASNLYSGRVQGNTLYDWLEENKESLKTFLII